jgi:hypothetical protein
MIQQNHKIFSTKTIVLASLLYSLLTNLADVKQGLIDGWYSL